MLNICFKKIWKRPEVGYCDGHYEFKSILTGNTSVKPYRKPPTSTTSTKQVSLTAYTKIDIIELERYRALPDILKLKETDKTKVNTRLEERTFRSECMGSYGLN